MADEEESVGVSVSLPAETLAPQQTGCEAVVFRPKCDFGLLIRCAPRNWGNTVGMFAWQHATPDRFFYFRKML